MKEYARATIVRAPHDTRYFCMSRETAQDRNLSWEARGMIAYILSKPDGWEIQVADLKQNCQKGRVYRILDELKAAGYLQARDKKVHPNGKWYYTPYTLHERPFLQILEPENETKAPLPENRDTDNQDTAPLPTFADTENRDVLDNTEIQSTEKEKEPHAPLARPAIREIKIQSVPSQQMTTMALDTTVLPITTLDDKSLNKQARAIITTYLRVSKVVKSNAYAIWTQDAKDLAQRGIDNKQIARFVTEKQKEDFFKDKSVTWNVVTSQIIAWTEAYTRAQQKAAQPDLHEQWGVTEDDYMLPNLYDSPFDLKFYPDDKKAG